MNARDIIQFFADLGHCLGVDGDDLIVRPRLDDVHVRTRLVVRKPEVVSYLRTIGGHRFAALRDRAVDIVCEYGACISCGVPHAIHGAVATEDWNLVTDANDAPLFAQWSGAGSTNGEVSA